MTAPRDRMTTGAASAGLDGHDLTARILVVDDLRSSRLLIGSVLMTAGYCDIVYAEDGAEAVLRLREQAFDMVILDIVMPRMDGFEVCRQIRGELQLDIPILIQTGVTEADRRVQAFDAGASDIVSKPINAGELVSRVRLHLDRRRLIRRLEAYRQRMQDELEAAQDMQMSLLASDADVSEIVVPRGASVETFYQPSNTLGGDLWQIFPVDETRFAVFMVDLSGHGVSAAINAFRVHMLAGGLGALRADPSAWMEALNRGLAEILPVEHFAAAFYGVIDPAAGRIDYAAAGWPEPVLLQADGGWQALDGSGLILGCSSAACYEARSLTVAPGDRLFVYSDALCEDFDRPHRSLPTAGVAAAASAALADDSRDFAGAVLDQVFADRGAGARGGFRDDMTFVLVTLEETA